MQAASDSAALGRRKPQMPLPMFTNHCFLAKRQTASRASLVSYSNRQILIDGCAWS